MSFQGEIAVFLRYAVTLNNEIGAHKANMQRIHQREELIKRVIGASLSSSLTHMLIIVQDVGYADRPPLLSLC